MRIDPKENSPFEGVDDGLRRLAKCSRNVELLVMHRRPVQLQTSVREELLHHDGEGDCDTRVRVIRQLLDEARKDSKTS